MNRVVPVLLAAFLVASGCATQDAPASTSAPASTTAPLVAPAPSNTSFSIPAPEWKAGYSWTWQAGNASGAKTARVDVLGPVAVDGVTGWAERVTGYSTRIAMDDAGRSGPSPIYAYGSGSDMCSDAPWTFGYGGRNEGMLEFPLVPGKRWTSTPYWTTEFEVGDRTNVTVPAGTFDAVKVLVRAFYPDNSTMADWAQVQGTDESSVRSRGVNAILYYAPAAAAIVKIEEWTRWQSNDLAWSPGEMQAFVPIGTDAARYAKPTLELTKLSLVEAAPMDEAQLRDEYLNGYCEDVWKWEKEQALRDWLYAHYSDLDVQPKNAHLAAAGPATWSSGLVDIPEGITVAWSIRGPDGASVAKGEGSSFTADMTAPGLHLVEASVGLTGSTFETSDTMLSIDDRFVATMECVAVADPSGLAPAAPSPLACDAVPLKPRPGSARITATATTQDGVATPPCSYLALRNDNGALVAAAPISLSGVAQLAYGHVAYAGANDDWHLEWHPTAGAASEVLVEVAIEYPTNGSVNATGNRDTRC